MAFVNRTQELRALRERMESPRGEFLVVWGRRRVGKTELLSHFLHGEGSGNPRRGIHLEATEGTQRDHLDDVRSALVGAGARGLITAQPLSSWEAALEALGEWAGDGPAMVVLDEFQYIARATPDIGSLINRWWRRVRESPLLFVVSGSEVSFFERDVLTGTMFGRRTGQLRVLPMRFREAAAFLPGWEAQDIIRAYAVCGGMPYYLEHLDPAQSLGENIVRLVLRRDGLLREEARLLLHEELTQPEEHFSILRAIAGGCTRFSEIVTRTGLDQSIVADRLRLLQALDLVARKHPATVRNPERTKLTRYEIKDGYLRFYFTFVLPYEGRLRGDTDAERHLHDVVAPTLDRFTSKPTLEEICHDHLQDAEPDATAVGPWWGSVREGRTSLSREVDGIALDTHGNLLAMASCKWTNTPLDEHQIELLDALAPKIAPDTSAGWSRRYLYSRSGFTPGVHRRAEAEPHRVRLVTPEDLLAGP